MRSAIDATDGDLVVFVDADVTNFGPHFVTGLLQPLLADGSVTLVKGFYQRPLHGTPDGGGRVTELMARPVIDLLFPHLSSIEQPLAGETAAPRWVLEKCELADGYAVELALLIDVASLLRRGAPSPRSISVSGSTGTDRSPSSARRPPTSCGRRWPGPRRRRSAGWPPTSRPAPNVGRH